MGPGIQGHLRSVLTPHNSREEAPGGDARPTFRARPGGTASQGYRTFLLVLGRGRLQEPAKGVDALIRFVSEQLVPQDFVGVLAWNRATAFTVDHAKVAQLLERFKAKHEEIEALLLQYFSGYQNVYGSNKVPKWIQAKIDEVFLGPNAPELGVRSVEPGQINDAKGVSQITERAANAAQRGELIRDRIELFPDMKGVYAADLAEAERFDIPFDAFIDSSAITLQDLGNIYAAIEYLRYLEGEKHLIFVTAAGLRMPRQDDDRNLAATANEARVTVNFIQTGGLRGYLPTGVPGEWERQAAFTFDERFSAMSMKNVAQLTGGQTSIWDWARSGFDRVNIATMSGYHLGY